MSEKAASGGQGVSFGGLLAILFTGLKLTGLIDWSWWWVLSPIWIPLTISFLLLLVIAIIAMVAEVKRQLRQTPTRKGTR